MALTGLVAVQAVISLRSYLNPEGPSQETVLNYSSPNALTGKASAKLPITVPASTTNFEINLPTLFANFLQPLFVSIADITNPGVGFSWGTTSGSTPQVVGPGLFLAWMADGATALQPIYVTNNSTNPLVLQVGAISN